MKNVITRLASGLLLSTVLSNSVAAMPAQGSEELVAEAFGALPASQVELLDNTALEATEGKILPIVGIISAIATVDLALAGFFWGVYVPYYAQIAGDCLDCNTVNVSIE